MEELYFIIMLYPNVIQLLSEGKLLPTDVININNGFNNSTIQNALYEDDTYITQWTPNYETLKQFNSVFSIVKKECTFDQPNETVITYSSLNHLTQQSIIIKKAILLESYQ